VSDQFKALILSQDGESFKREIKSIDKIFLKNGDVTVKVEYSGLNYKDALILKNGARLVKEFPHIPGIDFSGIVEESNHKDFKNGDEVILTGWRVGEIYFGGYSQYAKVNGDFLVKKPKNLDLRQSMIIGTAGLTALMCSFTTKATREELLLGDKVKDVIVSGASGGVGSMAVMMLSKLGCSVTAITGKDSNTEYLKSLGAKNVINTSELNKDSRPLDKGLWDGAVDTVGGKVLENILSQTKDAGIVAACGNAADIKLNTTVMPFIIRGVKLWGINSVTASIKRRQFLWNEAGKLIDFGILEKSIKEIKLEEIIDVFPKMLKGETSGRYIINLNK
jgi:alcohol dehydrogenase/acrylyl-CoA reductase (NADPH)